jgi:hypothetical protein
VFVCFMGDEMCLFVCCYFGGLFHLRVGAQGYSDS